MARAIRATGLPGQPKGVRPLITRPLTEADRAAAEAFCAQAPEYNIFLLSNLDKLGTEQDLVRYWGQFDEAGEFRAIIMRYHVLWYLHDAAGADLSALAGVVEEGAPPRVVLSDNVRTQPGLAARLKGYRLERDFTERLRRLQPGEMKEAGGPPGGGTAARLATDGDIDRLTRFYERAPEGTRRGRDSVRRSVGGGRRTYFVADGDEVTAAALTTAELPGLTMVGGLWAAPEAGEGDLGAALTAILRALLAEGRVACTVTHDQATATLCDRLGFQEVGPWRTVHLVRN